MAPPRKHPSHGSLLANLLINIIIPTLILTKLSGEDHLGPVYSIVVALSFPLAFGVRDFLKTRETNLFSILGVISVALTGGISLLQLDPKYIAIKEATIPGLLGLATLISIHTRFPLVRTLLLNEQVMHIDKIHEALHEHNGEQAFEEKLRVASYLVAGSFFLSSVLNYVLAKVILVSPPGTSAYSAELGKMTALSFPVIAVPSMIVLFIALYYLLHNIQKLTGLELEDIFQDLS